MNEELVDYVVYQYEICPETGKEHVQGYAELKKQTDFNVVKEKVFNDNKIHLEKANGTGPQNRRYCTKEDSRKPGTDPYEKGRMKRPGTRNDIHSFVEQIGKITTSQAIELFPNQFIKYHRGYEKILFEKTKQEAITQFRKITVYAHVGKTGTGKTRKVYEDNGYENVYSLQGQGQTSTWFDGYDGQRVLLIDDFYGWIPMHTLLNYLDGYPLRLPIKGSFTYAKWDLVYFTSNREVSEWWKVEFKEEEWEAFKRRLPDKNIFHF